MPASFHVGDDVAGKAGTLHITTRRLIWISTGADRSEGYAIPFRSLTMHAVSRDSSSGGFPRECIYTQVEGCPPEGCGGGGGDGGETAGGAEGDGGGEEEEEEEEEDGFDEMTELRLVPQDPGQLEAMFKTLCDCAAMNPDSDDEDDEEGAGGGMMGGAGEFYYNEEEVLSGAGAVGRAAMLDHYDSLLQMPTAGELDELIQNDPGRFEDDNEEEDA